MYYCARCRQRIAAAESVMDAEQARQTIHRTYRLRFPKASERLDRDWARMLTDYQFKKDHWRHPRAPVGVVGCLRLRFEGTQGGWFELPSDTWHDEGRQLV